MAVYTLVQQIGRCVDKGLERRFPARGDAFT